MKKILMVALCMVIVPMLFAAESDADVAPGLRTTAERMIQVCPTPDRAIKPTPTRTSRQEDTLYYDNMTNVNAIGMNTAGYHWAAAVRFTTTELAPYAGYNLIAVIVYRAAYTTANDSIMVYGQGTPILPGPVASAQAWTPTTGAWNRIDLPAPVAINGTDDIWIADAHTESPGGFPSGCGPGPYVAGKGDWVNDSGAWYELGPLGLDYNWNIWAIVAPAAAPTTFWDFEDGLQGWTHTNGYPFPRGWDVEPSSYYPAWTPPDAGDSTMWIDSDAAGSVLTEDTTWSPAVVPPANMAWLKYGLGYRNLSSTSDSLYVGVMTFTSGAWNPPVQLKRYSDDYDPAWDSLDVSAYGTADSIRIYFYYSGNYDWYVAFDNVGLHAPEEHDVASIEFLSPGLNVAPGTEDVIGVVANLGISDETYDVHCVVTDPSVVLDTTLNITTPAGESDTLNFGSIVFQDGYTYDIMMATLLVGDADPTNDTLTQSTFCTAVFWKIYTSSLPQASYYHACVYSDVTGAATVYSLGGDPTYTSIFEFDCATETWSTSSATLNHEARRLAAAVVDGKIYAIGGMPGSGTTALNYCQEYDPVAGTVTDKTAMPTARQFLCAVAWNDTLIYVMGGQSGASYYSTIEIYDPANDAWTTATSLPEANRSFACGIAGDIIYVTGGYSSSGYMTATRIGVIDPTNPQSITWSSGPDIPTGLSGIDGRSRVQGACVETDNGWMFYFTCGDDHGDPAYDTWFYDPNDALWHQTLDKPTPISNSQCAVWVPSLDNGTFFCAGGYNTATGSATNATEGLVNLGPTGIQEAPVERGLSNFGFAAMANPITHNAGIAYTITTPGRVSLKVYDRSGRLVETLVNSVQQAGTQIANWNVENIANGVYFIRLVVQGETATHKMILVK